VARNGKRARLQACRVDRCSRTRAAYRYALTAPAIRRRPLGVQIGSRTGHRDRLAGEYRTRGGGASVLDRGRRNNVAEVHNQASAQARGVRVEAASGNCLGTVIYVEIFVISLKESQAKTVIHERQVIVQTASSRQSRANRWAKRRRKGRAVWALCPSRAGEPVNERHHTGNWEAENNASLVGVGAKIIALRVEAKFNLSANMLVEVVGPTGYGADVDRVRAGSKGRPV